MTNVSIIIPAYITSEKGLDDLASLAKEIAKQMVEHDVYSFASHRNWELIIINDGSPISFEERSLCLPVLVTLIQQEHNRGVARARNLGITMSDVFNDAKYVVFVDADDQVPEDFVKIIKDRVEFETRRTYRKADIVQFNARYEDGSVGYPTPCAWGKLIRREWIGADRFDTDQLIGEEDTLFRKEGKAAVIEYDERIIYLHRQSANPDSLMKRFWRGEVPRRRGGECYKPEADLGAAAQRTCEGDG